jgi:hypothetical protein
MQKRINTKSRERERQTEERRERKRARERIGNREKDQLWDLVQPTLSRALS